MSGERKKEREKEQCVRVAGGGDSPAELKLIRHFIYRERGRGGVGWDREGMREARPCALLAVF